MALTVMLSSTLRGSQIQELRKAALDGILKANCAASACESWVARSQPTLEESTAAAAAADVYVLVLGPHYGSRCAPDDPRSYTEAEFDSASAAKVPRLAFIQRQIVINPTDGDATWFAEQLVKREGFVNKVKHLAGITVKEFDDSRELAQEVRVALMLHADSVVSKAQQRGPETSRVGSSPFVAINEYTLLSTDLAGRRSVLRELDAWATGPESICVIEALGGFGKSALSWWWWWEVQRKSAVWGKGFWISFDTGHSGPSDFFMKLHAHLTGGTSPATDAGSFRNVIDETLELLRRERHMIVLDGFERLLFASGNLNANVEPANGGAHTAPTAEVDVEERLRMGARAIQDRDLRQWLLKVANGTESRVLITSRYFPQELEVFGGRARRGVRKVALDGLSLTEATSYWDALGLDSKDRGLSRLVDGTHGHPLSLGVMAGNLMKSGYRTCAEFFLAHPSFDPLGAAPYGHDDVFADALASLGESSRELLLIVALHAMPIPRRDLQLLMLGDETDPALVEATGELTLKALIDLQDRRLLFRNSRDQIDMHPVIRSAVRGRSRDADVARADRIAVAIHIAQPRISNAKTVDELYREIQIVYSNARQGRWKEAMGMFAFHLRDPLIRLNESRKRVEIVREFFTIDNLFENPDIRWHRDLPFLELSDGDSRTYQLRRALEYDDDAVDSYNARQDFAMAAGNAYEDLGEYGLAQKFFALHSRTCTEPLCQTMQRRCTEEAGLFGDAAQLLRDGARALVESRRWRSDPSELRRLANGIFDESLALGRPLEARLSLARMQRIVAIHGTEALLHLDTIDHWLIYRNLMAARLAFTENEPALAVSRALEVLDRARNAFRQDHAVDALRVLAESLQAAGRHREAAFHYDELIDHGPDHSRGHGALRDRARRARNRIGLGQHEEARLELDDVLDLSRDAAATQAEATIYLAELFRATGKQRDELRALHTALGIYGKHRGTPIDSRGVRMTLGRLRELKACAPDVAQMFGFVSLPRWPLNVLVGADEARAPLSSRRFRFDPIWTFSELRASAHA